MLASLLTCFYDLNPVKLSKALFTEILASRKHKDAAEGKFQICFNMLVTERVNLLFWF